MGLFVLEVEQAFVLAHAQMCLSWHTCSQCGPAFAPSPPPSPFLAQGLFPQPALRPGPASQGLGGATPPPCLAQPRAAMVTHPHTAHGRAISQLTIFGFSVLLGRCRRRRASLFGVLACRRRRQTPFLFPKWQSVCAFLALTGKNLEGGC